MHRLTNQIKDYAWGSTRTMAELIGVVPGGPMAEWWLGAHPSGSSTLEDGRTLGDLIAADPAGQLGPAVAARFGGDLPFLMKLLSADAPLSIQAHPSLEQAAAGYAREEAAGIDRDAPERVYRDHNHKPELICALSEFDALYGFRPVDRAAAALGACGLDRWGDMIVDEGVGSTLAALLSAPRATMAHDVARAAEADELAGSLAARYPGDPGVLVALLMNRVRLAPGEALYLGAGRVHAYLGGTGVEVMANSDNVVRCGLTDKHIDVAELLAVADTSPVDPPEVLRADAGGRYRTVAAEFELRRLSTGPLSGPAIALCLHGRLRLGAEVLGPAQSVFIGADELVEVIAEGTSFATTVPPV